MNFELKGFQDPSVQQRITSRVAFQTVSRTIDILYKIFLFLFILMTVRCLWIVSYSTRIRATVLIFVCYWFFNQANVEILKSTVVQFLSGAGFFFKTATRFTLISSVLLIFLMMALQLKCLINGVVNGTLLLI